MRQMYPGFLCSLIRNVGLGVIVVLAFAYADAQSTNIAIGPSVLQPAVKRLGVNLSFEDYYDSGQMTKSLVFRNPGFEGEIYNSTIRCALGTAFNCVDDDAYSGWPTGFWNDATFEVIYGASQGRTGTITSYTAANGVTGGIFTFSTGGIAPATGDYMIVRMTVPGNATAGWWPTTSRAGSITTNTSDLPPGTTGLQTAALSAPTGNDVANLAAYFDSTEGRSFVMLNGTFQLTFQAKGTGGSNSIRLYLARPGVATYLNQVVPLTNTWATYTFNFTAAENGLTPYAVALQFSTVGQDSFLIDNVSLTQTNTDPTNTTVFRDPVVNALKAFNPGVLRFWAGQLGDTLDNLIADPYSRKRAGYLAWYNEQDDISYGLHEFLQLCELIGAEPWFVVPTTFSTTDASNLIQYLAGASTTPYGAKRAARGQLNPWTSSFTKIHLEFGNEAWNGTFKGGSIEYPAPYGQRAQTIFGAMRGNAAYISTAFDLVLGGQAASAGRNQGIQDSCNNNDSFAVAPYMMNTVNSFLTNEDLFGSTFAEAEAYVSPAGTAEGVSAGLMLQNQQAIQASNHPVPMSVYEMNLSTTQGTITQAALNSYTSSLGAGLAVADAMLQQMGQGVITQNLFALPQYQFLRPDGSLVYLWGAVVDMGVTDRRRPQFLALELANQAIGNNSTMLQTVQSGANPTWNQPLVNTVQLSGAHDLQSFAFSNSSTQSVIVFNLHRSATLPVTFSGANAPGGSVQLTVLTSANLTDTNETAQVVTPVTSTIGNFNPATPLSLPPYSMTVLTWGGGSVSAPLTSPVITSVTATGLTSNTATVTWTTSQASSSQVEYGKNTSYGSLSAQNSSLVTSHSVVLTGLTSGASYDYAVMSGNSAGTSTSANFSFSTSVAPAPVITSVTSSSITPTSATITWTTDQASTTQIEYGTSASYGSVSALNSTLITSHSVALSGLTPGTTYDYAVLSNNSAGTLATSANFTFTTSSASNPLITSVTSSSVTSTSVNITWTTDQASTTQLEYGTTASYGSLSWFTGALVTAHAVTLSGLTPGTTYDYAVLSKNSAGTLATSANFTFTTSATSAPVITSVTSSGVTSTSATITWTTDQASTTQMEYGTTASYGSFSAFAAALVTSHTIALSGLSPGTIYNYAVLSQNSAGILAVSANFTFATSGAAPAGAPVISSVTSSSVTSTSVTITWTTDQASSTQLEYGTTTSYGSLSAFNTSLVTAHTVALLGLTPGTTYDYLVWSRNAASTLATSANFTFTTSGAAAPVISSVTVTGITATSATVTWTTDQASTTQVEYGTTASYGSLSSFNSALATSHTVTLSGLTSGTTYHYAALSTNSSGRQATSASFTFATTTSTGPPRAAAVPRLR